MDKPLLRLIGADILNYGNGRFVLTGYLGDDHHSNPKLLKGSFMRSSLIVKADFETNLFETLNTRYQVTLWAGRWGDDD